ncbi:hypothetical protein, partial [Bacteroides acidifaciens]|uniref:hypothetical protein n=1 Tax=Bacteroides acidifaciens TaxID=85831 RepID=UPI0025A5D198
HIIENYRNELRIIAHAHDSDRHSFNRLRDDSGIAYRWVIICFISIIYRFRFICKITKYPAESGWQN